MSKTGKLIGTNLLILLVYSLIGAGSFLNSHDQYAGLGFGMIMVMAIGIHVFALMIISIVLFVKKDKARGRDFLISMFVVLLVGFSACFGGMTLIN
ncbi:MAG: hypothetical protein R2828_24085 [Saprospiraceae bacterium]